MYVSRVIIKYTRPGELRGIINFSLPIRPSRSLRIRSPTFPITAAPQPLPIRLRRRPMAFSLGSVCLISFLVPCSSARKRDYTAVATAAATAAPCIDRGRCSPVEQNNVNQTRGWRGQVPLPSFGAEETSGSDIEITDRSTRENVCPGLYIRCESLLTLYGRL